MNRSGRSVPAGPAITPHASSGWSARACDTILSRSAGWSVSMCQRVLPERAYQRLLQVGEPVVDPQVGRPGIGRVEILAALRGVLGDLQPHPEGQPDVVQRTQPDLRVLLGQLYPAAVLGQRVQH